MRSVADGSGGQFVLVHARLLLRDERPQLVELDAGRAQADHHAVVQFGASASDLEGQRGDGAAIDASDPGGGANAKAITEGGNDFNLLFARKDIHGLDPWL